MITEKFQIRIDKYNKEKDRLNKSLNSIATIRLLFFIFIMYLGYRYVKLNYNNLLFLLISISIIIFISLIIYHNKIKNKFIFAKNLIDINTRYLDRINGKWINFPDFGEDFIDKKHRYSSDLDIVGHSSLYQKINLSSTWIGRKTLAKDLLNPNYDKEDILKRQAAI